MVDPFTIAIAAGAVGGASGKVVETAADLGRKWIADYYSEHGDKVKRRAEENAASFLADLAVRLEQVEARVSSEKRDFESTLRDPDFAATMHRAMIASARTGDDRKHSILARVIADRLEAVPESLRALATNLAVEAVPYLTRTQLDLMGFAVLTTGIRPHFLTGKDGGRERIEKAYLEWLFKVYEIYIEIPLPSRYDLWHLDSVNLITFRPGFGFGDLEARLLPSDVEPPLELGEFLESPLGEHCIEVWEGGLTSVSLTPAGLLVGTYVHDGKTGEVTTISVF